MATSAPDDALLVAAAVEDVFLNAEDIGRVKDSVGPGACAQ